MKTHAMFLGAVLCLASVAGYAQAPVPLISQPLVPDATAPGGTQFTLTVNGTGFRSNSAVNWNGSPLATTYVSAAKLTAIVPAADIANAGTAWITVVNPPPGGGASLVAFFPITNPSLGVGFNRHDINMGVGTSSGATGDFNGDGKLDLAISKNQNDTVSILLGNGDGTFGPQVDYPEGSSGSAPDSLALGDFNGDGALDIAVRNELVNTVSVLLGKGDGTFGASVNNDAGFGFSHLVTGDFNGDGKLDIATTNAFDDTVSILLGKGDGTFQPHAEYAAGYRPIPIATGDLNGDGHLDLVIGNTYSTGFSVLLGNGDGTFQAFTTYQTLYDPESVILADFDGDGKLDLAIFVEAGGIPGIQIFLGNGDGTFRSFDTLPTSCGDNFNVCVGATADINGDGKLDLILRNSPANTVQVLLGNGDGTFKDPVTFATGNNPEQVIVGDFNGDGRLDFVVPNFYDTIASVFIQQAPGSAVLLSASSLSFGPQLHGVASPYQTVTMTNVGSIALNLTNIATSAGFHEANNCGSNLPPGGKCKLHVDFLPGTLGKTTGILTIADDAPNSPQTVSLSGIGTIVTLSATSLSFGNQTAGSTSPAQTVTLTNHSTVRSVPITHILIKGGNFPSFEKTTTCGAALDPGASCTISVTFTPKQKGSKVSTVEIWNEGGATPLTITLSGTGT